MKINIELNLNYDFKDSAMHLCAMLMRHNRQVDFSSVITGTDEPEKDAFYVYLHSSDEEELRMRRMNHGADIPSIEEDKQRIDEIRKNGYFVADYDLAKMPLASIRQSVLKLVEGIEGGK